MITCISDANCWLSQSLSAGIFLLRRCVSPVRRFYASGLQIMPPRARRSTSRPIAHMYIDPAAFGALSIANLRSLCVQHGIQSTGVRKTLERWLRELNNPQPTQQNINEHESAAPNNDETAARRQERPEFTDGQMRTIQQLIADTVKQSAREIATEAAKAAVNASSSLLPQRPASLVRHRARHDSSHEHCFGKLSIALPRHSRTVY